MLHALVAAALLAAAPAPDADTPLEPWLSLQGWTADGAWLVFRGDMFGPREGGNEPVEMLRLFRALNLASGEMKTFRVEDQGNGGAPVEDRRPWDTAESIEAGAAWLRNHPLSKPAMRVELYPRRSKPLSPGWDLEVVPASTASCDVQLTAVRGSYRRPLVDDACGTGSQDLQSLYTEANVAWTADGTRLAVQWSVQRRSDTTAQASHNHLMWMPAQALVSVDVLDAGAGDATDTVAGKLESAGYSIAHRGRALRPRPASAVFYAKGFEDEAKAMAALIGAAPTAVQPLTWRSPFALTAAIAAAKK